MKFLSYLASRARHIAALSRAYADRMASEDYRTEWQAVADSCDNNPAHAYEFFMAVGWVNHYERRANEAVEAIERERRWLTLTDLALLRPADLELHIIYGDGEQ